MGHVDVQHVHQNECILLAPGTGEPEYMVQHLTLRDDESRKDELQGRILVYMVHAFSYVRCLKTALVVSKISF